MASFFNSAPGYFLSSFTKCRQLQNCSILITTDANPIPVWGCCDHLHTYLYVAGDNPIVTKNWSGILKSGWQRQPHSASLTSTIIMQRKWLFILGLFGSYVKKSLLMPFQLLSWFGQTINRAGFWSCKMGIWDWSRPTWLAVDRLYSRYSLHSSAFISWESKQKDQAGLFRIDSFERLVLLQQATLGCFVWGSLFCIPSERNSPSSFLKQRPVSILADFLKPGELFVDIGVGVDRGYYDSILIKSVTDMRIGCKTS